MDIVVVDIVVVEIAVVDIVVVGAAVVVAAIVAVVDAAVVDAAAVDTAVVDTAVVDTAASGKSGCPANSYSHRGNAPLVTRGGKVSICCARQRCRCSDDNFLLCSRRAPVPPPRFFIYV